MTTAIDFTEPHFARLSDLGIRALAALIHEIRPDWDSAGIASVLRVLATNTPADKLAHAAIRGATDPTNRTPATLRYANSRAWADQPCEIHPGVARHISGECAGCHADRTADEQAAVTFTRRPPTDRARQARAELTRRATPKTTTATHPTGDDRC